MQNVGVAILHFSLSISHFSFQNFDYIPTLLTGQSRHALVLD